MRKKQIESLLQPVHRDGKLSVDQAVVKQAWDHVSVRVRASPNVINVFVHPKMKTLSSFTQLILFLFLWNVKRDVSCYFYAMKMNRQYFAPKMTEKAP